MARLWRRRRHVAAVEPCDVTQTSGRLFSPDCPLNRPLNGTSTPAAVDARPLYIALGPTVTWTRPGRPRDRAGVTVDLAARTVRHYHPDGTGWAAPNRPLDGPAGGYAAGLVLEREIAAATIEHAVAVEAAWPPGTRLTVVDVDLDLERRGWGFQAIAAALRTYGAYVVRWRDGPDVHVVVERPADLPWPDDPGLVYRTAGLGHHVSVAGTVTLGPTPRPATFRPKRRRVP